MLGHWKDGHRYQETACRPEEVKWYRRQDRPRHGCWDRWRVPNLEKLDRGVAIAIGESLDLSVTKMMNAISRALSGLIEWIGKNQEVVKKVALIVAGVVAVGGPSSVLVALLAWLRLLLVA